jgi:glutamyl endopeptidase
LRFRITPGRNGPAAPFGTYTAHSCFAPRRFVQNSDRESDYGIVVLDRAVPSGVQPFPLLAPSAAQIANIRAHRLLHIAGYPGDKPGGTMWEHAERLDQATARSLLYSIDTCPGHSGSAVWCQLQRGGIATVIAIHVAGPTPHQRGAWGCRPGVPVAPEGMYNRGIRLTPTIIRQIRSISNFIADAELVRLSS